MVVGHSGGGTVKLFVLTLGAGLTIATHSYAGDLKILNQAAPEQVVLTFEPGSQPAEVTEGNLVVVPEGNAFAFKVDNGLTGKVDLYAVGASPEARQRPCRLTIDSSSMVTLEGKPRTPCGVLLKDFYAGRTKAIAISPQDKADFAVISLDLVSIQSGASATGVMKFPDDGTAPTLELKDSVARNQSIDDCYVYVDTWHQFDCSQPTAGSVTVMRALRAAVEHGDQPSIVVNVFDAETTTGEWRRVPLELESTAADADTYDLLARCSYYAQDLVHRDVYGVCVDVSAKRQAIIVLSCGGGSCAPVGDLVDVNRSFVVRVWTDDGNILKIDLGGTAGTSSGIYEPPSVKTLAGARKPPAYPMATWSFGPRKPGQSKLTVVATKDKNEIAKVEYTFTVQDRYWMAIRLGVAFSWLPNARKMGVLSTPSGQRYSAVVEGEDNGLFRTELVTGFTRFFGSIRQDSYDVRLGFGVRVGVLSAGANEVKPLSSIAAGLELSFGPDMSIGLFGGIGRHDLPKSGYEPGRLLAPTVNDVPTYMAATWMGSVVLNFTPGVSKRLGVSQ